jgi:hypothetical protein
MVVHGREFGLLVFMTGVIVPSVIMGGMVMPCVIVLGMVVRVVGRFVR